MTETIAAISTSLFPSAIGVIRVSGPGTIHICTQVLQRSNKPLTSETILSNIQKTLYCEFTHNEKKIDQIIFVFFQSPHSYTGEDLAEFHLHGNPILLSKALEIIFSLGARPAEKGEFTKRAYLSGKLDITEAEAIGRLISARSRLELELAQKNVFGEIHKLESKLRSSLMNLKAECEAEIDFSTEDLTFESFEERRARLISVKELCLKVLKDSERANNILEKLKIVIYGEPNTGKSSLMNILLGKERAIVSPIAGTTRDFLSEEIQLGGIPIQLVDTAGVRETDDHIEKMGIQKSEKEFATANIRLVVVDISQPPDSVFLYKYSEKLKGSIVLWNKSDIKQKDWTSELKMEWMKKFDCQIVEISCTLNKGIEELLKTIENKIQTTDISDELILLEDRNKYLFKKIVESLSLAEKHMLENAPVEIYVKEIDFALEAIGKINGKVDTEEILGRIFSKFCVGK